MDVEFPQGVGLSDSRRIMNDVINILDADTDIGWVEFWIFLFQWVRLRVSDKNLCVLIAWNSRVAALLYIVTIHWTLNDVIGSTIRHKRVVGELSKNK